MKVTLVLTGDVGQYAGMCGALGGWDSLTGVLVRQGRGPVARDEDVLYAGPLSRKSEIKACGTKPSPTEDQVDVCSATLVGKARMNVELEVYEGNRGAYIKMAADTTHSVDKTISGCPEARDWLWEYYPDGASGIDISTVPSGPLLADTTYSETGVSLKVDP